MKPDRNLKGTDGKIEKLEALWEKFKDTVVTAVAEICGIIKGDRRSQWSGGI